MVRLHPRGLVGHQRIGGSMGFIKAVVSKFRHEVEHLNSLVPVNPALCGPFRENFTLGIHFRADFLPMARRSRSAPPRL